MPKLTGAFSRIIELASLLVNETSAASARLLFASRSSSCLVSEPQQFHITHSSDQQLRRVTCGGGG